MTDEQLVVNEAERPEAEADHPYVVEVEQGKGKAKRWRFFFRKREDNSLLALAPPNGWATEVDAETAGEVFVELITTRWRDKFVAADDELVRLRRHVPATEQQLKFAHQALEELRATVVDSADSLGEANTLQAGLREQLRLRDGQLKNRSDERDRTEEQLKRTRAQRDEARKVHDVTWTKLQRMEFRAAIGIPVAGAVGLAAGAAIALILS